MLLVTCSTAAACSLVLRNDTGRGSIPEWRQCSPIRRPAHFADHFVELAGHLGHGPRSRRVHRRDSALIVCVDRPRLMSQRLQHILNGLGDAARDYEGDDDN